MNNAYVLHLILQSPNLQKLIVGAEVFGRARYEDADLDIWERECPPDFTFKQPKIVVLEVMTISANFNCYPGKKEMSNRVLNFPTSFSKN
ncbi:hypothetical protein AgCh_025049 [Apium graveolens]